MTLTDVYIDTDCILLEICAQMREHLEGQIKVNCFAMQLSVHDYTHWNVRKATILSFAITASLVVYSNGWHKAMYAKHRIAALPPKSALRNDDGKGYVPRQTHLDKRSISRGPLLIHVVAIWLILWPIDWHSHSVQSRYSLCEENPWIGSKGALTLVEACIVKVWMGAVTLTQRGRGGFG